MRKQQQRHGIINQTDVSLPGNVGPGAKVAIEATRDLQTESDVFRWTILHYQHNFDHVKKDARATVPVMRAKIAAFIAEELQRAEMFEQWNAIITIHSLRSEVWVKALTGVAEQELDIAARRAETASRTNYQDWLNGGPAQGLGRQHRMSRTAVGWVPTKVDRTKTVAVDDLDETDGLSAEELAEVMRHECLIPSPLDA